MALNIITLMQSNVKPKVLIRYMTTVMLDIGIWYVDCSGVFIGLWSESLTNRSTGHSTHAEHLIINISPPSIDNLSQYWSSCLCSLVFVLSKTSKLYGVPIFLDFQHTPCKLFQKYFMRKKIDIYMFAHDANRYGNHGNWGY